MSSLCRLTAIVLLTALCMPLPAAHADGLSDRQYVLPPDAGVINVKDAKFGAVGDGKTDDTDALRAAIRHALDRESRYAAPPFVYLPDGTYLISGTLEGKVEPHGWSGGWRAGLLLLGQTRDGVVIKLKDEAAGFQDPARPQPVLITGSESDKRTKSGDEPLSGGGNRAFRHSFINLTIDIGRGNPGAVGIDYMAHNRGTIESVTIRSSDPQRVGHTGLKMTRNWPGPALINNVRFEGFERGIDVAHFEYSMTFEDLELIGQREAGIVNKQNMLAIHQLQSDNRVPVYVCTDGNGLAVIVDGHFKGGDESRAAVTGKGDLYLRDIVIEGYGQPVKSEQRGAKDATMKAGKLDLYVTERFALGGDESAEPLRLPIASTPEFWTEDLTQWVSPQQFLKNPNEKPDDWTDTLQAALDSGKPVVYLPNGRYRVSRTLTVPPTVRLLIGFQSAISVGKDDENNVNPLLRFTGKGGESTTVEHLWISGHVEHDADRAVAFRHVDLTQRYGNTEAGTGDVFFEDTIGPKPLQVMHPQRLFARQLNIEFGEKSLIENHGGTLWLLGFKTEGEMVCIDQTAGQTELLGGLLYPLRDVKGGTPAFRILQGDAALTFAVSGKKYPNAVRSVSREGEQNLEGKTYGGRAAALIEVRAGAGVAAAGGAIERDVVDEGGVPFWNQRAAQGEVYVDKAGQRWSVLAMGNQPEAPAAKPLTWNDSAGQWQGHELADQAPTYSRERVLRGRPAGGKLVGMSFQPANAGRFALTGKAKVETWGPDGPITIVVTRVDNAGATTTLIKQSFPDNSTIDWTAQNAAQKIELGQGDRLVISFASEKGGTASLDLAPGNEPTGIERRE